MNSMAQQAVPNGIGQSEFFCAHWTSQSSFVVRTSKPELDGWPGPSGGVTFPAIGSEDAPAAGRSRGFWAISAPRAGPVPSPARILHRGTPGARGADRGVEAAGAGGPTDRFP